MSSIFGVTVEMLPTYWPMACDLVESACKHSGGRYTTETVAGLLVERRWQLWLVLDNKEIVGAICTSVYRYPTELMACGIMLIAGKDADEHHSAIDQLKVWGREQGCHIMESSWGRIGWVRRVDRDDVRVVTVIDTEI